MNTYPTSTNVGPATHPKLHIYFLCQFDLDYDYLRILPALLPCRRTRSEMVKPRSMASQTRKAALIPETPPMLNSTLGIYKWSGHWCLNWNTIHAKLWIYPQPYLDVFHCRKQGFGSGSVSGSAWFELMDPDPDPGGQKWPKKLKKGQNFHLLKCWMFSFEGWRLLL